GAPASSKGVCGRSCGCPKRTRWLLRAPSPASSRASAKAAAPGARSKPATSPAGWGAATSGASTPGRPFPKRQLSLVEELHRHVGQYAASNRDWRERCLGREIAARQHDLIDLAGELLYRGREDKPAHMAPQHCAHAHRARFSRGVQRRALQGTAAVLHQATPDGDHLAVSGRIVLAAPQIAATRNDAPTLHNHRAEWEIGAARLFDRHAHEPPVVFGGCEGSYRRRNGERRCRDRTREDGSSAYRAVAIRQARMPAHC